MIWFFLTQNSKQLIFSLDIDGNDYWVLSDNTKKSMLLLWYNHYIGNNVKKTILTIKSYLEK